MTVTDIHIEEFLEAIRKSGLLEGNELDDYLQRHGPVPSTRQLAAHMIRDGFLTNFQARMLLEGKHRGFVANNKYRVLELLAVGGMGAVYLCEHTLMRRLVAMKVLSRDQVLPAGAAERFLREARAAAALDHPNIVRAFDLDRLGPTSNHCLIMEFVDGISLQSLVEKNGAVHPAAAADYIAQSAAGLLYAHQAGLVHRDIKPANLLLSRQGQVKVLDLGLARFYGDSADNLTREHSSNAILGTADYIAPEQAVSSSGNVDTRADMYSLGCTFYFLLTGQPPFPGGTAAHKLIWHQTQEPERVERRRPNVPPQLAAIVHKMMAKRPQERYPDMRAVVEDLRPFLTAPVPPPNDRDFPPLCPAVRKLITETTKANPHMHSPSWPTLSTTDFVLPPAPIETSGMQSTVQSSSRPGGSSAMVDLTEVPTWRGRKMTDTAGMSNGGTAVTNPTGAPRPKRSIGTAIGVGVACGMMAIIAFAAYQANRPPANPNPPAKAASK